MFSGKIATFARNYVAVMNNMTDALRRFFGKPFFTDPRTLVALWLLLPVAAALAKMEKCNNFLIFKHVFWHAWRQLPLYAPYPAEHGDTNHYGPLFSLVVAPFAVVPHWVGLLLWEVMLAMALYVAVRRLPVGWGKQVFVYWFCAHELLTALFMSQFNIAIAAIIVGAFVCVERGKDATAAFLIMLGTFVKLYGIVGLAFFLFSRHKARFALALAGWAAVFFALPMLISSPEYIVGQYQAWYDSLAAKNADNMFSGGTNQSLLGLVRKISGCPSYSDLWLIVPGLAAFAAPYLRLGQWRHLAFRCAFLASTLLFVVLFSTGSESSTYIIALTGAAVWYVSSPWKRSRLDVGLMVFAFILTSMSPSDLFPAYLRKHWVQPYALKALPCVLIWLKLVYEMLTRDYSPRPAAQTPLPHAAA